jgi:FlaA1/EpsC-like NDP-sugar epimerase
LRGPIRDLASPDNPVVPLNPTGLPGKIVSRLRRDLPLVVLDLGCALASYVLALVLRFEGSVPAEYWRNFWALMPLIAFLHLFSNYVFSLYGRMWRYASVLEARRLLFAGGTAVAFLLLATVSLGGRLRLLPLSVVLFGAAMSLIGFGAIRFQSRVLSVRRP